MSSAALSVVIGRSGAALRAVVAGLHSRAAPILDEPLQSPPRSVTHNCRRLQHKCPTQSRRLSQSQTNSSLISASLKASGSPPDACQHLADVRDHDYDVARSATGQCSDSGRLEQQSVVCSAQCARLFVTVRCGFAKDMMYRASSVFDQDHYGDDACFVASHGAVHVLGVADGVGGWRLHGVDPSVFSRSLMDKCSELVRTGEFNVEEPAKLLANAYAQMKLVRATQSRRSAQFCSMEGEGKDASNKNSSELVIGSSTACVLIMDKATSRLHTANLGDSGFVVLRHGRVAHRSHEQLHYFNAPYQLTLPPPQQTDDQRFLSDSPESASKSSFDLEDGDLVVLATDGLYDNLPTHMIENELAELHAYTEPDQLQSACNSLALQARRLSLDPSFMSPFARRAVQHGLDYAGGKQDDITILLVAVTTEHTEQCTNYTNTN